jgi:hypothetical protein
MRQVSERPDNCDWCGCRCRPDEHHIAQGASRKPAGHNPACILWLCRKCHDDLHADRFKRQIGLAILMVRRPAQFSLDEFYRVTQRRWPDRKDVELWRKRLCLVEER